MDLPIAFNPASSNPASLPFDLITAGLASGQFSETRTLDAWSLTEWSEFAAIVDKTFGGFAMQNLTARADTGFAVNEEVAVAARRDYYDDDWTIVVAAVNADKADKWHAAMSSMLPAPPPPPPAPALPDNIIPVAFWMQNSMTGGAYYRRRMIEVQPWAEVEGNYASEPRSGLNDLMSIDDGPGDGGKLILLHGPPGTGKTRSILSLFHAWKDWCSASVVTDSERFFGDPTYLNDLIFDYEGVEKWLLIVVEDGDEFIDVGQSEHKGQSIARLLNMADGIVGQGLNLMTLITTNVPMERLNPALARSGRCLADIHVGGFSEDDARTWLTAHDIDPDRVEDLTVNEDIILADLYALARGDQVEERIEFSDENENAEPEDTED